MQSRRFAPLWMDPHRRLELAACGSKLMALISPWRADFPGILALEAEGQTYLDSAATAQKPQVLLDALLGYYATGAANVHRAQHLPGERATRAFEASRQDAAQWLNAASAEQIIFTRGTTESLNLLAYGLEGSFHRIMGEPWVRPFLLEHATRLNFVACGDNAQDTLWPGRFRRYADEPTIEVRWQDHSELALRAALPLAGSTAGCS